MSRIGQSQRTIYWDGVRENGNQLLIGMELYFPINKCSGTTWKQMHNILNVLNTINLFAFKWISLCYVKIQFK